MNYPMNGSDTSLVLYRSPMIYAPTGDLIDDVRSLPGNARDLAADTITGAIGRVTQGVATERDHQVAGAVAAAMAQLQRDAPALYRPILADFERSATRTAAAALLVAEPWLADRVTALAHNAAGGAVDSGLAATARKVAPWAIGGLIVAVFVYGVTTAGSKR